MSSSDAVVDLTEDEDDDLPDMDYLVRDRLPDLDTRRPLDRDFGSYERDTPTPTYNLETIHDVGPSAASSATWSMTSSLTSDHSQSSTSTYSTISSTTSSKRSSQTTDQKLAEKQRKLMEKEELKRQKLLKKEEQTREREAKKRQKEQEKAERANARTVAKSKKPGECLKYIHVILEQSLLTNPVGAKLLPMLQEAESQYRFQNFPIPKLVCWQRESPDSQHYDEDPTEEEEVLVLVPVNDFISYVYCTIHGTDDINLPLFVSQLEDNLPGKKLTIVIQGVEKYFRDLRTLNQRNYRQQVQNNNNETGNKTKNKKINIDVVITRIELEETLTSLQLESLVNVKFTETDEETALYIYQMTKSVAETPFKRSRHEVDFSFLPDKRHAVKVEKDGRGLLQLWTSQILQFNNISPDIAQAIVAEFPSPLALMESYSNAPSARDAEMLLADIRVRRGAGVLETSRRIGKEMSKRIYQFMTCEDPNHVLK